MIKQPVSDPLLIVRASYKQNKFNLLREQTEGYSKLTTELTSSLGPAHSIIDGSPMESLSAIEARARPAWERVVGLVGYFDLDPNRALDIILDVFSVHLATHYSFFLGDTDVGLITFQMVRVRFKARDPDIGLMPLFSR